MPGTRISATSLSVFAAASKVSKKLGNPNKKIEIF